MPQRIIPMPTAPLAAGRSTSPRESLPTDQPGWFTLNRSKDQSLYATGGTGTVRLFDSLLGASLRCESGDNAVAGKFTSSKQGDWIAFTLFLSDGEGEVYININPVAGLGEFTTKDPEHGEVVFRELATVFLP